jgi:predicted nucleic acid-binding protein
MAHGIKLYDSLHIACAYVGGCDYFLTVDKQLLRKSINEIRVCNPLDFIRELEEL